MEEAEFLEIAHKLISNTGTEAQDAEWVDLLDEAAPGFVDLLYHDDRELSPEEALAELQKRKPIQLGPGSH